jgi:hypothetical protein
MKLQRAGGGRYSIVVLANMMACIKERLFNRNSEVRLYWIGIKILVMDKLLEIKELLDHCLIIVYCK